jgi:hypothetical protein
MPSLVRPLVSSLKKSLKGVALDELSALITSLFSAGEQGAFYIPRPIVNGVQSLFQDAAGTVPVTASGDPVGKMLDQSGNGNHATQSVSGSRPVYRTDGTLHWLEFDGVDGFMETGAIDFTSTDKMTLVAGLKKESDNSTAVAFELSEVSDFTNGSFVLFAPSSNGSNSYRIISRGTVYSAPSPGVFATAPDTAVISLIADIAAPILTLRRNSSVIQTSTATQGSGNYGNHPVYIGMRAGTSLPFTGNLHSLTIRGAQTTTSDLTRLDQYTATLAGVTL